MTIRPLDKPGVDDISWLAEALSLLSDDEMMQIDKTVSAYPTKEYQITSVSRDAGRVTVGVMLSNKEMRKIILPSVRSEDNGGL